jgi:uncharacterized protein (DUF1800 family)
MKRDLLRVRSISFLFACLLVALSAIKPLRANAQPSLAANPSSSVPGGTVTAVWTDISSPTVVDWIGLYLPGTANTAYIDWIYVSCSKSRGNAEASGSCPFVLPASLVAGTYELRLLANDGYADLATSNAFTVTAGTVATLVASPANILPGGTITAAWTGIAAPTSTDWIGLFQPSAADTAYIDWIYVSCSKSPGSAGASRSCPFVLPANLAPGAYNTRLFSNDGFTRLATSNPLTVSGGNGNLVRFLEQATFGPTQSLIAHVGQVGIEGYLDAQRTAPMMDYPVLEFWPQTRPATCTGDCQRDSYTYYQLQRHFFTNALYGQDQLRQRVAFALGQILVTSQVDVPLPSWMRTYQQLLYQSAFGNFRQLLYDVTVNPVMGRFLDMLNNRCQTRTPPNVNICRNGLNSQPNENYAREILQLFSIGTFLLNQDGTRQVDGSGNPIPTYDQTIVEEFSRVFTGWILATALPGPASVGGTVPNYRDPMRVRLDSQGREDYHDKGPKSLLNGFQLPGGQSQAAELGAALDNIAFHPNVAPFISKQLIQHLVTSNPSPAYVERIASVFAANANSPTQIYDVVRAILLDPEARGDFIDPVTQPNYGKLREPVQFITNLLRAFNANSDGVLNSLNVGGSAIGSADMSQDVFNAPSVFSFYPPTARVPGENALGPQFGIFSSLTSLRRANFANRLIFSAIPAALPNRPTGTSIDLSPWDPLASNPDQLIEDLNQLLLDGAMSAEMRDSVKIAVESIPASNARLRVRTALYLIATSSQYQVQR